MNEYKRLLWFYKFLKENREFLKFYLEHNVYDNEYYIELYVNNDIEEINIYTEDKRYLSSLVFDVVKSYLNLNNVLLETQDCMKRKLNNMKKELKQESENLDLDTRKEKWNKSNIEKYKDLFYLYSILKKYGKNIILYIDEYYKKDIIKFDIDTDIFSGDKSKLSIYVLGNVVNYLNEHKNEIFDKVQEHIKKKLDKIKEKIVEEIEKLPEVEV